MAARRTETVALRDCVQTAARQTATQQDTSFYTAFIRGKYRFEYLFVTKFAYVLKISRLFTHTTPTADRLVADQRIDVAHWANLRFGFLIEYTFYAAQLVDTNLAVLVGL